MDQVLRAVTALFGRERKVLLKMPSGWVGRPYDGLFKLVRVEIVDGSLFLELDESMVLTFTGPVEVDMAGKDLWLSGFSELQWDWHDFGNSQKVHHVTFRGGVVELIAPVG